MLNAIDNIDDVCARLALYVDDYRRGVIHPGGLLCILNAINDVGHVLNPYRSSVAISDDERLVIGTRINLIVGANTERLVRSLYVSFGLIGICRGQSST